MAPITSPISASSRADPGPPRAREDCASKCAGGAPPAGPAAAGHGARFGFFFAGGSMIMRPTLTNLRISGECHTREIACVTVNGTGFLHEQRDGDGNTAGNRHPLMATHSGVRKGPRATTWRAGTRAADLRRRFWNARSSSNSWRLLSAQYRTGAAIPLFVLPQPAGPSLPSGCRSKRRDCSSASSP